MKKFLTYSFLTFTICLSGFIQPSHARNRIARTPINYSQAAPIRGLNIDNNLNKAAAFGIIFGGVLGAITSVAISETTKTKLSHDSLRIMTNSAYQIFNGQKGNSFWDSNYASGSFQITAAYRDNRGHICKNFIQTVNLDGKTLISNGAGCKKNIRNQLVWNLNYKGNTKKIQR